MSGPNNNDWTLDEVNGVIIDVYCHQSEISKIPPDILAEQMEELSHYEAYAKYLENEAKNPDA